MIVEKKKISEESFPFISAAKKEDFLQAGYIEEEYFMHGSANIYEETGVHTKRVVCPEVSYCNRFLLRKPADEKKFSGDVMIEILNATAGFDIDRMWILGKEEIMRRGAAYIGITSKPDVFEALRKFDPERYREISWRLPYPREEMEWTAAADPLLLPHEKEEETGLFWDILMDLAEYVKNTSEILPAGRERKLYLLGWSQSAGYMTTYRNYFAFSGRGENLFDGYLAAGGIHSLVIPLNQNDYGRQLPHMEKVDRMPVPYISVQTESENAAFGGYEVRQDNSDTKELKYVSYELAGATHDTVYSLLEYYRGDDYLYEIGVGPQYVGENGTPSDYPSQFVFAAIYRHLIRWVREGLMPPAAPRIEVDEKMENAVDQYGNAVGGVRLPLLDAPFGTYYNYSDCSHMPGGKNPLFGHVEYFSEERLARIYGTLLQYEQKVRYLAEQAIDRGYLLEEDRENCIRNAVAKAEELGLKKCEKSH